jgi:hypothetical protein
MSYVYIFPRNLMFLCTQIIPFNHNGNLPISRYIVLALFPIIMYSYYASILFNQNFVNGIDNNLSIYHYLIDNKTQYNIDKMNAYYNTTGCCHQYGFAIKTINSSTNFTIPVPYICCHKFIKSVYSNCVDTSFILGGASHWYRMSCSLLKNIII